MVSISPVRIGNMALSNIGSGSTIESFSEQSVEARQINLWYDFSRQQALESMNWSFARKRALLAVHSEAAPGIEWSYRYQLPADCLSIRELVNPLGPKANAVPYTTETSDGGATMSLLTNLDEAEAVYTFDLTATSLFTPTFVEALALLLGYHICYPITANLGLKQAMLQTYLAFIRFAATYDGNEQVDDEPRDAEWIRNR